MTRPMPAPSGRLASLDALRGFSMFWLLGGTALVRALTTDAAEASWAGRLRQQFTHVEWAGFHFYDFIFPLFLFCIGVAVPVSVEKRLARGDSKALVLRHAAVRLWWMIFFGWWVNGNLLSWDPSQFALSYSVLMMLGLGYFMAVCLVLYTSTRTQIVVTIAILLGYWAVQMGVPFPGRTPGQFTPGGIFGDWLYDQSIDRLEAPWKSRHGRGMLISVWNHGATAMLGVFAGRILFRSTALWRGAGILLAGGAGLMLLGWLWSFYLPIVKVRWTSSYVLWCGGLSWILLALFHVVIDRLGWRKWAALFAVLGANSILAYLISTKFMTPFRSLAGILFDGLALWLPPAAHAFWMTLASYGFAWILLAVMHRHKIHLRL